MACSPPGSSVHEFSRQEHWSVLPCPPSGVFPTQGSSPGVPHCRRLLYHLSHPIYLCWRTMDYERGITLKITWRLQTGWKGSILWWFNPQHQFPLKLSFASYFSDPQSSLLRKDLLNIPEEMNNSSPECLLLSSWTVAWIWFGKEAQSRLSHRPSWPTQVSLL